MDTLWKTTRWFAPIQTDTAQMEQEYEAICLASAQRGETAALTRLYHAYQPLIYTLCFRMLGRAEDAEDATQSAFVHAFRALPGFRGQSSLKTWLYRIAVNESLSLLRKRKTAPDALTDSDVLITPEVLSGVVNQIAVQSALARVRPEHRAILILHYWEGLRYEEIAGVLGLSLPATKMRLHRARAEFETFYGEGR